MFGFLKQSTAAQARIIGPFIDDTDFKSVETGLTIANTDVKLSKNGATGVNKNSGGGTHIHNGMYSVTFDATDTDTVGEIEGSVAMSGALLVCFKFFVLEESIYAALFGSGAAGFDSNQRIDVGSWLGGVVATPSVAGVPEVDLTHVGGATTNVAALATNVDNVQTQIGTAGAGLTDLGGMSTAMKAEVNAEADTALSDYGANTTTPPTVGAIADAVWDEDIVAAHSTADTAGAILSNILPEKNAAFSNLEFLWVAASDHVTPVTGASTTSVTRSIDGGAFGAATGTLAEVGNGIYQYDASAADMNGTIITFRFVATGGTPGAPDDAFITIKTSG